MLSSFIPVYFCFSSISTSYNDQNKQNTSPDKLNYFLKKIERNCCLKTIEESKIFTRKRASSSSVEEAEKSLQQSAKNVKTFLRQNCADFAEKDIDYNIYDCSVSVDRTWQRRYGFSSLIGVIYLISMETGEVLDYAVKSKICSDCKARNNWEKTSERYKNWYIKHEKECSINHIESSGEWKRQLQ